MALTSAREGRLWSAAAAVQIAIYASLGVVRTPTNWLRDHGVLRLTVGALFLSAVIWAGRQLWRSRPSLPEIGLLLGFLALGIWLVLSLDRVEERVHLLEYGTIGGLIYAALSERRGNRLAAGERVGWLARFPGPLAVVLTALLGWGDEGIQALLPDRFYDVRDMVLNAAGGLLVISALAARRWVRARAAESPRP